MKFTDLNINVKLKKALDKMGFEIMMPIQEETIPFILNGENIIGEAETGTGKTAAFVLPLLNNIDFKSKKTECLIVTPTRELAMQIVSEIEKMGEYIRPSFATVVGGMSIREQVRALSYNPSIVVGTLGRINDHLRSNKIDLSHIKYFVLDEADEMLKEGWKEDIDAINAAIPANKQTLLFSATISKQILSLSKSIMDDYRFISVVDKNSTSINIDQYYIVMKEKQKFSTLTKLLDIDSPTSAIIFGRTKRRVDELNDALNSCGYNSVGIHGDLSQHQRNTVMDKFRKNQINILVATDVAARGLDISDITHVYNFDLPQEVEFYVHRVGRTGRAKKHGISYSFIKDSEIEHIRRIEKETKVSIKEKHPPHAGDVWDVRNKQTISLIDKKLSEIDITKTKTFAKELVEEYGAERVASVLIETLSKKVDINHVMLTGEPPVTIKRSREKKRDNYNNRKDRDRDRSGSRRSRNNDRDRSRGRDRTKDENRDRNKNRKRNKER